MSGHWNNAIVRSAIYLYFAAGMALLLSPGMAAAVHYQPAKRFPATFLLVSAVGIFGLVTLLSWNTFWLPVNARRWILLCAVSSLGILELIFAPPFFGSGGGA